MRAYEKGEKAEAMREKYAHTKKFVGKASRFWGRRCDYPKFKYINSKAKIIVTCKEHELDPRPLPGIILSSLETGKASENQ